MITKKSCRCSRNCPTRWKLSSILALRAQYFKQPSEKAATEFLAHLIVLDGKEYRCADSNTDTDDDEHPPGADNVPLVGRRIKKWKYTLPVLGTNTKEEVCDRAFERIFGISSTKRTSAKR